MKDMDSNDMYVSHCIDEERGVHHLNVVCEKKFTMKNFEKTMARVLKDDSTSFNVRFIKRSDDESIIWWIEIYGRWKEIQNVEIDIVKLGGRETDNLISINADKYNVNWQSLAVFLDGNDRMCTEVFWDCM